MSTTASPASDRGPRRSRPLRLEDPEACGFVTSRTLEQVFWLHPLFCSELRPVNREARRQVVRSRGRLDEKRARLVRYRHRPFQGSRAPSGLQDAKQRRRP